MMIKKDETERREGRNLERIIERKVTAITKTILHCAT
jgi:hypothetical protein